MNRTTPTLLAPVLLLLLLLLILLAWARSHLPRNLAIESQQGRLFLVFWEGDRADRSSMDPGQPHAPGPVAMWEALEKFPNSRRGPAWQALGFGTLGGYHSFHEIRLIAIPWWSLALLAAAATTIAFLRARRQRLRLRAGHCASCGYDLRATPDKCPECGSVPTVADADRGPPNRSNR